MTRTVEAELTWTGRRFERGVRIEIDDAGTIAAPAGDASEVTKLARRALLPGMISAHSHAFQRAIRGLGERFPGGQGSFWSWREAMYSFVERASAAELRRWYERAFREMLRAGITTVGEFHYLHHSAAALSGERDWEVDQIVLEAAASAGIRIVLLQALYQTGGIGRAVEHAQQRFTCATLDEFWKHHEVLQRHLPNGSSLGVVAHSVRAVPRQAIAELHAETLRRNLPFHMHVDEQRQEIADCIAAYGATPTRMLLDLLPLGREFTSVHATHTGARDLSELLERGGNVCIAPLTEGNLGDGFPMHSLLRQHPCAISLGTDSNARISMLEEMRMLEYAHRLRTESRGVWTDAEGDVARTLFSFATTGGARSLGIQAGSLSPGCVADMIAIDLDHPSLESIEDDALLDAWVFGAPDDSIASVCVAGRWTDLR